MCTHDGTGDLKRKGVPSNESSSGSFAGADSCAAASRFTVGGRAQQRREPRSIPRCAGALLLLARRGACIARAPQRLASTVSTLCYFSGKFEVSLVAANAHGQALASCTSRVGSGSSGGVCETAATLRLQNTDLADTCLPHLCSCALRLVPLSELVRNKFRTAQRAHPKPHR